MTMTVKEQEAVPHALVALIVTVVVPVANMLPVPSPLPLPVEAPLRV